MQGRDHWHSGSGSVGQVDQLGLYNVARLCGSKLSATLRGSWVRPIGEIETSAAGCSPFGTSFQAVGSDAVRVNMQGRTPPKTMLVGFSWNIDLFLNQIFAVPLRTPICRYESMA
jgi:hypothetical protein